MPQHGMEKAITQFPTQFQYQPVVENANRFKRKKKILVVGMGGSHLAANILQAWQPSLPLVVYSDYGFPARLEEELRDTLIIASSYSGTTEEVIDAYRIAVSKGYAVAAISIGKTLIDLAKRDGVPYVQMPDTNIQPRSALGLSTMGHLALLGDEAGTREAAALAEQLNVPQAQEEGKRLAQVLANKIPIIYASTRNFAVAYTWKIKFNETGKIPAFCNVVPELNHNEMTGFDARGGTQALAQQFRWIFLMDDEDHPSNKARMEILAQLLRERGLSVEMQQLAGRSRFEKIFSSILIADWCSFYAAVQYGVEAEQVPMVEEFKKLVEQKTRSA